MVAFLTDFEALLFSSVDKIRCKFLSWLRELIKDGIVDRIKHNWE